MTTVVVKEKSVLPWMVAGVSVLVLVGVLLFMDRGSDEPQPSLVATGTNNTLAGPQPVTNTPATTGPPIPQPPAPDPQLAQTFFERGQNFRLGTGGESQDYAEAAKWYRKAALQGHALAQNNLGVMYATGEGVPKDDLAAYAWWNIATANGGAKAKINKPIIAKKLSEADLAECRAAVGA